MSGTVASIHGIGWITKNEYGSLNRRMRRTYDQSESLHSRLREESVFLYQVKNFGRFDPVSRMTCCAAALALHDAHMTYFKDRKLDIGIIGTNETGCFQPNLRYFRDYIESGRTLGRGILFVYTLPSIPLAEAAIRFGFQGPLLYINCPERRIPMLLNTAKEMILREETSAVLALHMDEEEAACFVLAQGDRHTNGRTLSVEQTLRITGNSSSTDEIIRNLLQE
jgi:hypothetical protein